MIAVNGSLSALKARSLSLFLPDHRIYEPTNITKEVKVSRSPVPTLLLLLELRISVISDIPRPEIFSLRCERDAVLCFDGVRLFGLCGARYGGLVWI